MAITNNNTSRSIENDSSDDLKLRSLEVAEGSNLNRVAISEESTGSSVQASLKVEQDTLNEGFAYNFAIYGDSVHKGDTPATFNYGSWTRARMDSTNGLTGTLYGSYAQGRYNGSDPNGNNEQSTGGVYGVTGSARVTGTGNIEYVIGNNISSKCENSGALIQNLQGQHTSVSLVNGTATNVAVSLLDFDYSSGSINQDFAYIQIQNDAMPTVAGKARAINSDTTLLSEFAGSLKIGETPNLSEDEVNAGSLRYVETANRSAVEMLMKTGASAYSWVVIQENTF